MPARNPVAIPPSYGIWRQFTPALMESYMTTKSRVDSGWFLPRIDNRATGPDNADDHAVFVDDLTNGGTFGIWNLHGPFCTFFAALIGDISYIAGINTQSLYFYLPFQPFAHPNWYFYPQTTRVYDYGGFATDPLLPLVLGIQDAADATATNPFNHAPIVKQNTDGSSASISLASLYGTTGGTVRLFIEGTYLTAPGVTAADLIETL